MKLNSPLRSFALLAAGLAACLGMLFFRIVLFGHWYRGFLAWNLFLAVVPLLIASLALFWERRNSGSRGSIVLLLLSFLWLVFFPNASYLFTDFIHLIQRGIYIPDPNARGMSNMRIWYDIITASLFAFVGHLIGLGSLYVMHNVWKKKLGRWGAWAVVGLSSWAAGYGVFIGRFERWNSWHLFTHPEEVWTTLISGIGDPDALVFSFAFSVFLIVSYFFAYVFKKHLFVAKESS